MSHRIASRRAIVRPKPTPQFHPGRVPEIAAGYWWDSGVGVSGLGDSSFTWAEQNGHAAFNLLQSTVAQQPSRVGVSGGRLAMHYAGSPTAGAVRTAGAVQAGWTGKTYIAGWWRFPDGLAGVIGDGTSLIIHSDFSTNRRLVLTASFDPDSPSDPNTGIMQVALSASGSANATVLSIDLVDTKNWHFYECFIDPTASAGSRRFFRTDLASPSVNGGTSDATFTTLFNGNAQLSFGSRSGAPSTRASECAWCVYANGIPSDADRAKLYNFKRAA